MDTAPIIKDVILAPGNGSFFYDDQAAIRAGAINDGFCYLGAPLTPGFTNIRMPSRSLSIGLVLSDDSVVWGDMMSVQYTGAAGRDPLFDVDAVDVFTRSIVVPRLLAVRASNFVGACDYVLAPLAGKRLPLAVEY
ncbi:methylaspartate ammonia-lyase, partial [Sinorhizobium meliloti]|nr:methylaspartate ammonia-lyase [Sinorhizobium meliloti]MDW9850792.1 methylaspartate ammonia-lyase [Sinorhizobium meliloti]MDX0147589.1 methylaspartate ammonia-lyase [Sinorhizobium meliloti]MDX0153955.1 methylaspartate ammonia-lyase [Sinorhizobium meliloti]MDX0172787.1 methylaspartate ammonia-lyase [Sinorhizobium meliloti]